MAKSIAASWAGDVRCCRPTYTKSINIEDSMHVQYIPHASNGCWVVYASAVRSAVMSAGRSCGGPREWANAVSSPIVVALKKQVEWIERR